MVRKSQIGQHLQNSKHCFNKQALDKRFAQHAVKTRHSINLQFHHISLSKKYHCNLHAFFISVLVYVFIKSPLTFALLLNKSSNYNGRNFFPNLYNTTPSPFAMLDFLSLEFASFLYNIEKGEGRLALNINRI